MKKDKQEDESQDLQSPASSEIKYCSGGQYSFSTTSSNIVLGTANTTISNISGSNSIWISPNYNVRIQKQMVQKILDGQIELESLIDKEQTEVFDIDEMNFEKKKSRIKCSREIDVEYLGKLKSKNELLLEFVPFVDPKESHSTNFWYYNSPNNILNYNGGLVYNGGTTLVGQATSVGGSNNTITINPNYWTSTVTNPSNYSLTFGASNSVGTVV